MAVAKAFSLSTRVEIKAIPPRRSSRSISSASCGESSSNRMDASLGVTALLTYRSRSFSQQSTFRSQPERQDQAKLGHWFAEPSSSDAKMHCNSSKLMQCKSDAGSAARVERSTLAASRSKSSAHGLRSCAVEAGRIIRCPPFETGNPVRS